MTRCSQARKTQNVGTLTQLDIHLSMTVSRLKSMMRFPGFSDLQQRIASSNERTQTTLQEYRGNQKRKSFNIKVVSELFNGSNQNSRIPPTKSPLFSAKLWSECDRSSAVLKWSHLFMASVFLLFLFLLRLRLTYVYGGFLLDNGNQVESYELGASDENAEKILNQHSRESALNNPPNIIEATSGRIVLADVYPDENPIEVINCLNDLTMQLGNVDYGVAKIDLELLISINDHKPTSAVVLSGVGGVLWPHGSKFVTSFDTNSSMVTPLAGKEWLGHDISNIVDHIIKKELSEKVVLFVVNPENCLKLRNGSINIPHSFWESLKKSQKENPERIAAFKSTLEPLPIHILDSANVLYLYI